jgi:opacity protein-like surface antigen
MKKLLLTSALALSFLSLASAAKVYEIKLSRPTKVGNVQLKPGQYRLKINGGNAVFIEVETSKSFTTPAKLEDTDQKFDQTVVDTSVTDGMAKVKDIQLGGSKTKLSFDE